MLWNTYKFKPLTSDIHINKRSAQIHAGYAGGLRSMDLCTLGQSLEVRIAARYLCPKDSKIHRKTPAQLLLKLELSQIKPDPILAKKLRKTERILTPAQGGEKGALAASALESGSQSEGRYCRVCL